MGLLIHTQFITVEGIPVQNVYCRITSFTCDIVSPLRIQVLVKFDTFVSRETRLGGYRKVYTPTVPDYIVLTTPMDRGWNTLPDLYSALKGTLIDQGLVVEDVNPDPEPVVEPVAEPGVEPVVEPATEPPA
jgi:hypothetical protein